MALDNHRQRLDGALEVHAFNRDVDDINDRINEKVIVIIFSMSPSHVEGRHMMFLRVQGLLCEIPGAGLGF